MDINEKTKSTYSYNVENYKTGIKGITLISLVITIIILIILAGVTINLTLGENGLFNTAKETVNSQKIAEYKDRVEISRATVAINNLGEVTIDKLIEQIYKDKIVSEGKITKISETEAEMMTDEGYKFKVTLDGVEYIEKNGEPPVEEKIPVAIGNVTIGELVWNPSTHKASVTITKGDSVASNLNVQYQVVTKVEELTEAGWIQGTNISDITINQTVFARLWNGKNGGEYTSLKITEKVEPIITVTVSQTTINSITATVTSSDAESGMPTNPTYTFYIKKTNEPDTAYEQKQSNTETTCVFSGLEQNTSYTVKVTAEDLAGNTGIGTKEGITGTQKVSKITLNKTTLEIKEGETETLTATIEPINAYNKNITWSSNDESVATVSSNGEVIGVGEGSTVVTVVATDGSGASAECTVNVTLSLPTVNELKVGDYIKYDTGNSEVGDSGIITCRVLYPASSEYGLQIISDKNVKTVTLGGFNTWEQIKTQYNKSIEILNDETESYINPLYATDARCVGSLPTVQNGIFVDKDKHNGESGTIIFSGTLPTGWSSTDSGCFKNDTNFVKDTEQLSLGGMLVTGENYWLASRIHTSNNGRDSFFVRIVNASGGMNLLYSFCLLYNGITDNTPLTRGIRACIALDSNSIKIVSGDGTSAASAYVIGK